MIGEIEYYVDKSAGLLWDYADITGVADDSRFYKAFKRLDAVVKQLKENNYENFTRLKEARDLVRRELLVRAKRLYFAIVKARGVDKENLEY